MEAFQKLKDVVVTTLMLQLSNFEFPSEVHMDALDCVIVEVLMQGHHWLAFKSPNLKECE